MFISLLLQLFLIVGVGSGSVQKPVSQSVTPLSVDGKLKGYSLSWHDEFDGNSVNKSEWNFRTGERFWSTQRAENVSVADGKLKLSLRKERFQGSEYTAGGLISKRGFRHGYYEARIKMPRGMGWHTSFWMMRNDDSRKLELDACEQDSIAPSGYTTNVHTFVPVHNAFGAKRIATPDLSSDFHVWGCEFTPTTVSYYFDGRLVDTRSLEKVEPDDLNIWLTAIAAPLGKTERVDDSALPALAEFDYVRFFEKQDSLIKRSEKE